MFSTKLNNIYLSSLFTTIFLTFPLVAMQSLEETSVSDSCAEQDDEGSLEKFGMLSTVCSKTYNAACWMGKRISGDACRVLRHIERNKNIYGPVLFLSATSLAAAELLQDGSFVCPFTMRTCWYLGTNGLETEIFGPSVMTQATGRQDHCFTGLSLSKPDSEAAVAELLSLSDCNGVGNNFKIPYIKLVAQVGQTCIYNLMTATGQILHTLVYDLKYEECSDSSSK